MPELSDDELKVLQGSKQVLDRLLRDPKTKRQAENLIKTHYPESVTSDDLAQPYVEKIEAVGKKLDEFLTKQTEREIDSSLNAEFKQLRDNDYTDEGIEKIKKLMVDRSIKSPLDAAAVWEKQNPPKPAPPAGFQPTGWGFGDTATDENVKSLFRNEDAWADTEAQAAWNEEVRRNQVRT